MPPSLRTGALLIAYSLTFMSLTLAQESPRKTRSESLEQDEFEEKAVQRATERMLKVTDTEGRRWQRELAKAYPKQIGAGLTEDEVGKWFDVLAGGGREWRRDSAPAKPVTELFDRIVQKLELGPVPSLRREEFLQFAKSKLVARPDREREQKPAEKNSEAERTFRVLDRDGSGALEPAEWTDRIRTDIKRADADGNRRISLDEYRTFFDGKVADATEAESKAAAAPKLDPAMARGGKLPAWFTTLDTDGDGQIGLYEWRAAGRPLAEFSAMDLDGDGLLPSDEYQRYLKKIDNEGRTAEAEKRPSEMPPEHRAGGKVEKK